MFTRIGLFVLTNILVIAVASIVFSIFGIGNYVDETGLNLQALMVFCLVWGMVGSVVSLLISRWSAKKLMRVKLVSPDDMGANQALVRMVHDLAKAAGLPKMPEVGVFESPQINAFATGPSKSRSLVAFSSGLLSAMSEEEIRGVAAHEIAHIQNGDMVTMTLIQGVINAFVMFFARVIGWAASNAVDEKLSGIVWFVTVITLQILFGMLGSIVTCWFSRKREFRADAGSARLAGSKSMIAALEALQRMKPGNEADAMPESMSALAISGGSKGFLKLWSTHPDLADRISALQKHTS